MNRHWHSFISSRTSRLALSLVCVSLIVGFGLLRVHTQAQFTFASLMLLPVLANTWLLGRVGGWTSAILAALMWGYADHASADANEAAWIPGLNAFVHLINYGIVVELVHKVQELLQREANNARVDRLTGLLNRRGFMEAFEDQAKLAHRLEASFSIAFIDLDRFKRLNDTRGHKEGDTALKTVGATLLKSARSTDVIGRLGGDEFCVLAFSRSANDAEIEASRLHAQLTQALLKFAPVGASIGVAFFDKTNLTAAEMIQRADEIMYAVKEAGKGNVRVKVI